MPFANPFSVLSALQFNKRLATYLALLVFFGLAHLGWVHHQAQVLATEQAQQQHTLDSAYDEIMLAFQLEQHRQRSVIRVFNQMTPSQSLDHTIDTQFDSQCHIANRDDGSRPQIGKIQSLKFSAYCRVMMQLSLQSNLLPNLVTAVADNTVVLSYLPIKDLAAFTEIGTLGEGRYKVYINHLGVPKTDGSWLNQLLFQQFELKQDQLEIRYNSATIAFVVILTALLCLPLSQSLVNLWNKGLLARHYIRRGQFFKLNRLDGELVLSSLFAKVPPMEINKARFVDATLSQVGIHGKWQRILFQQRVFERVLDQANEIYLREVTSSQQQLLKMADNSKQDPLTRLHNRFGMYEYVSQLDKGTYGLFVIDLDHFKRFNDQHGHSFGDLVLKHLADFLRENFETSKGDLAARIGGEEFVLICRLREADADQDTIMESLRRRLESFSGSTMTLSGGGVIWHPARQNFEQALTQADTLLYQAKGQGRNQILLSSTANSNPPRLERENT